MTRIAVVTALLWLSVLTAPMAWAQIDRAAAPAPFQWETYTYPGEEFAIALPRMPMLYRTTRNGADGRQKPVRIYGTYDDDIIYLLYAFDEPQPGETAASFALHFNRTAELLAVRDLSLGAGRGMKYVCRRPGPNLTPVVSLVYAYVTKRHGYVLQIYGADEQHPAVQRVLTSFALSAQPAGRLVMDDETPLPPVPPPAPDDETPARIFEMKEVSRRAFIFFKPEPEYTERARLKHTTGEVRVTVVLNADGRVTHATVRQALANGLTASAVRAARHMLFIPAEKDGRKVAQSATVVYNFNIY